MIMLSRKKWQTPHNEIIFRNEMVERVNKAKFHGVIVDQHLNWKDNTSYNDISKNISKSCAIIYRISINLDNKLNKLIYYTVSLIPPWLTASMYGHHISNKHKEFKYC